MMGLPFLQFSAALSVYGCATCRCKPETILWSSFTIVRLSPRWTLIWPSRKANPRAATVV